MILKIEKETKERTIWSEKCRSYIAPLGGELSHTSPTSEASFPCPATQCDVSEVSECGVLFTDLTLKLWNIEAKICVAVFEGHGGIAKSLAFSPDAKILVSGSEDGTIRFWDLDIHICSTIVNCGGGILSVVLSPDRKTLVSALEDRTVRFWNVATRSCITTLEGHSDGLGSDAFSPDATTFVSASEDETIKL